LKNLKGDFNNISGVLASLVGGVQDEFTEIWPVLGILSRYLGHVQEFIINFSMEKARDAAWSFAEELSPLTGPIPRRSDCRKGRHVRAVFRYHSESRLHAFGSA
jgi:Family of unknown function (DUF5995)